MTAREVIEFAVKLNADREMETLLESVGFDADEKILKNYINSLNIAVDTIYSRYYFNTKTMNVVSDSESRVPYEALSERLFEIIKVKNKRGEEVEFYSLPFSLYLPKPLTEYVVSFKFLPRKVVSIDDEVEVLPFISIKAIAYLMVSDIYLARGMYDESKFFFSKFEADITGAISTKRARTLKYTNLF